MALAESIAQEATNAVHFHLPLGFVKGFTWGWLGYRGQYLGEGPKQTLKVVHDLGANWISLAFACHMKTGNDPVIKWSQYDPQMVTDEEVRRAIKLAHGYGLHVIMKPVVERIDEKWRGTIKMPTEADWNAWWENYTKFIVHYAQIANKESCKAFCVGCEMQSIEHCSDRWRRLVMAVRKIYPGVILYNAANVETIGKIDWWDAVDVLGVSGYHPVGTINDQSLEKMLASWKPVRNNLRKLCEQWRKPLLFVEIGMRSAHTASRFPSDWTHKDLPYDGDEQARYYQAALETFWNEAWCMGFCWWEDWPDKLYSRARADHDVSFCIYGKPAEAVLREWYRK